MTSELEAATRAYRRAQKAVEKRRDELFAAVVKATDAGVRQVKIVEITGYTRERIRQIVDADRKRKTGHDARSTDDSPDS